MAIDRACDQDSRAFINQKSKIENQKCIASMEVAKELKLKTNGKQMLAALERRD